MKQDTLQKRLPVLEILYATVMIILGCMLPLYLENYAEQKNQLAIYALEAVALTGLGLQFFIYLTKSCRRPLKPHLVISIVVGMVLVGLNY